MICNCPNCNVTIKCEQKHFGKTFTCPKCSSLFQIGTLEPPPPPQDFEEAKFLTYLANSAPPAKHRRRETSPDILSATIAFFDPSFSSYVTPWIIRITWCFFLLLALIQIVLFSTGSALSGLGVFRVAQQQQMERQLEQIEQIKQQRPPKNKAPKDNQVVNESQGVEIIAAWIFGISLVLIGLLWVRVCLECCIVIFDINNTLKQIS